ncbi:hypothetical protein D1007_34718 [Hordeum vulgare]|nr:hypothetical protein D1007_34718 [Hordeum vulgare]
MMSHSSAKNGWVTPEIPPRFFTITSRLSYFVSEDFFQEEEEVEGDNNVNFVWEGNHQRQQDGDDDDDDEEPITVLQPEYKHDFTTFGKHVRTYNDDDVSHDDEDDDGVPQPQQIETNHLRQQYNT